MTLTLEQMKANRKLWVEALRSGKYKQNRLGWLRIDGRYCCLGVLADVAGCEWEGDWIGCADGEYRYPPDRAMNFVGLGRFTALIAMNDAEKRRFTTIAKFIEGEPAGLFIDEAQP